MLGVKRGIVRLEEYNPEWVALFEMEKQPLISAFGSRIQAIEHIGSTAIPGMCAKPIIDMNVAVESLDDINDFIHTLPKLGYEYIPERRFADRQFFPKGLPECRTHHLNLVEIRSETGWRNPLLFRDYLRAHEEARAEYRELKEKLATQYFDNRDEYTEGKGSFIHRILKEARKEANLVL